MEPGTVISQSFGVTTFSSEQSPYRYQRSQLVLAASYILCLISTANTQLKQTPQTPSTGLESRCGHKGKPH